MPLLLHHINICCFLNLSFTFRDCKRPPYISPTYISATIFLVASYLASHITSSYMLFRGGIGTLLHEDNFVSRMNLFSIMLSGIYQQNNIIKKAKDKAVNAD